MRGSTSAYIDLAGIAEVGDLLLDVRPALLFAADGARVLWANAAGAALMGESGMGALLRREITPLNPLREQVARLARTLPTTPRIEILRLGNGLALSLIPAACRRVNFDDRRRAVLAIALDPVGLAAGASLATRAERLCQTLSHGDCVAAILDRNGREIGAVTGYDEVASDADISAAIATARNGTGVTHKATAGREGRHIGAVHFTDGGRALILVIIGPPQAEAAEPVPPMAGVAPAPAIAEPAPVIDVVEAPVEMMLPLMDDLPDEEPAEPPAATTAAVEAPVEPPPAEPTPAQTPIVRFTWQTDADARFAGSPAELVATVGESNGAVAGLTWQAIADPLGLDADGRVVRALDGATPFSATVYWPDANAGDRVAVDLTGMPTGRGHDAGGFRGFGVIRPDDRREDTRPVKSGLVRQAGTPSVEPEIPPPPESPALPPPSADSGPASAGDESQDADRAAQQSIEAGGSNVVRMPGTPVRALPAPLSGMESDAFRRIAEALGKRQAPATAEPSTKSEPSAEPGQTQPPAPAPAPDIDLRLLDRLPVGIAIVRDRKILYASRMLLDLLGYDSPDGFEAAGGPDTLFPGRERLTGALPELGGILRARRNDGTTVPVRAWLHAVTFGGSTALMLSLMAATDRSGDRDDAMAESLVRSEARAEELAAILDTATDGVIVIDARGKIMSVNHAAEALFGIEGPQYAGRYFTDLLADESQKEALDYLDGLASNGVASVLNDGREVIGRVPHGGLIPMFMTMGRIGTSDKFAAVLRDITHWKNVEEELTAAKRSAEAANQQKSDFLAKISHEIRTPLNAIIGFSEVMMSERFGPIGNARYRDYLHDIHVSGEHLMSLINDLLDLSKIEAGKLDLSFEAVPVNAVIQETVALMQPQANRERIIIRTSLSVDVPNVVADPRSFRQILLNLLSNAIKFTRAGGQVIVSTTLETSGEVVVRIRDTGIGMTARDLETAMKPFRQVAIARDDREHGTGLGLPLTKALVEANRATFAIESAPNEGTLVKVAFPTTRVLAG